MGVGLGVRGRARRIDSSSKPEDPRQMRQDKRLLSQSVIPLTPQPLSRVGERGAEIVAEVGSKPHTARLSEFRDRNLLAANAPGFL